MNTATSTTRQSALTLTGPNWFVQNFMEHVPVGSINPDIILSVAIQQLKLASNANERKIQIGEAVYDLCTSVNHEYHVTVFQYTWEALKQSGTTEQKNRFRMAINAANKTAHFITSK